MWAKTRGIVQLGISTVCNVFSTYFFKLLQGHAIIIQEMEPVQKTKGEIRKYRLAIVKQMLQLATAGFGLVAALAWNELIQAFIEEYIKPQVGVGSGIISLALYALIVTVLAVLVTLQLSKLAEKLEKEK